MYNPTPKLTDWPWLKDWIDAINTIPFPERDWTEDQHLNYLALMDEPRYRTLRLDRQNLERLIDLASSVNSSEVLHVVRDRLAVIVLPSGELELFTEGPSIRRFVLEKVPIDKLKRCPGCGGIFWEKTKRSQTCGKKTCADTLGNRKRSIKK